MAGNYIFMLDKFEIIDMNALRSRDWSSSYMIPPENLLAHSKHSKLSVALSSAKDSCKDWGLIC